MPLTLIPPGRRKNNPFYLARGTVDGREFEVSTKTKDAAAARRFAKELARKLAAGRLPRPGEAVSFKMAAQLYADFRELDLEEARHPDAKRINKLIAAIGPLLIGDIRQVQLVDAANLLCANKAPATKNREVMRPAASILHYCADAGLCAWLKVKLFKEPRPITKAVSLEVASALVQAAPAGPRQLFLLWSFRQGTRISDTLRIEWPLISMPRQVVKLRIGKGDEWTEAPLHSEIFEELAAIPEAERAGRLFPWRTKSGVYKWLRPLRKSLGVHFTPHMARHSLGTWLNEMGAGLRTIMGALRHTDPRSSIRYQNADVEIIRAASQKLGDLSGKTRRKAREA